MKTRFTALLFAVAGLFATTMAQPACGYSIDTDGDHITDGTLYRDIVYQSFSQLILYNDLLPGALPSITYRRDVELYNGTLTDLKMDVYYPNPGADTLAAKDKPVIFFFYGGGFVSGTSIRVKDLCLQYSQRGYVCVAPNYRLGFPGAYEADSMHTCEDLRGPARAAYRALIDAQAAMRWITDSAFINLGIDVDPDNFFVHGPSFFPVLSHMQNDEVPNFLKDPLGDLDDALTIKASVGRSAAINAIGSFIDADDQAPFLIFHGTCDKSVPFRKLSTYKRFECDTIIDQALTQDYSIYGSYLITQQVNHYYEYYPICGLHHSLKNIEEGYMVEPVAEFFYKNVCNLVIPSDAPVITPLIVQSCEVSDKCKVPDYYSFCDTAEVLPASCTRTLSDVVAGEPTTFRVGNNSTEVMKVVPNPTSGSATFSYINGNGAGEVRIQLFDLTGRMHFATTSGVVSGLNVISLDFPTDLPRGTYLIVANGKTGPRVVLE